MLQESFALIINEIDLLPHLNVNKGIYTVSKQNNGSINTAQQGKKQNNQEAMDNLMKKVHRIKEEKAVKSKNIMTNLEVPWRYTIRETEDGCFIRCVEFPTIRVLINQSYVFSEQDARKLGECVIMLDGAGQFGPIVDEEKQFYNLDHHQGCLRAFTLATCEQSLILVLKGLELDKGDWRIYANEPDLDTLFAIWVLLNYKRLRQMTPETRDQVTPLIRLEGAIDANGFEIAEFCGLTQELIEVTRAKLNSLHKKELEIKRSGQWNTIDMSEYAVYMLGQIDKLIYTWSDFIDFEDVDEEYEHVEIGKKRVAVICSDSLGIYDLERRLKKLWGDRLGIIVLEKGQGHYTLRRTASLAGIDLNKAYNKLNLIDPNVDGRPPEKRWGGSDDIGGSPRPQGSGLSTNDIGKVLYLAYRSQTFFTRFKQIFLTLLSILGLFLTANVGLWLWPHVPFLPYSAYGFDLPVVLFSLVLLIGSVGIALLYNHKWRWLFGWRRAVGMDWLLLAPSVLISTVIGGTWLPHHNGVESITATIATIAILSLALELTYRGLAYGMLIIDFKVQQVNSPWFVSPLAFITAILYAISTFVSHELNLLDPPLQPDMYGQDAMLFGGAFIAGIGLGMIRERTLSIWPGFFLQVIAGLLRIVYEWF